MGVPKSVRLLLDDFNLYIFYVEQVNVCILTRQLLAESTDRKLLPYREVYLGSDAWQLVREKPEALCMVGGAKPGLVLKQNRCQRMSNYFSGVHKISQLRKKKGGYFSAAEQWQIDEAMHSCISDTSSTHVDW